MSGHLADIGTAITTLFLVAGAVIIVILLITEYAKRLKAHVDSRLEAIRVAVRHELSEHDTHRQRLEQRVRGMESDLLELSRSRAQEANRDDSAIKSLIATVADLEKDKEAPQDPAAPA